MRGTVGEANGASGRVLVAGVGNIFFGDDGFGSEVARRLTRQPLPAHARVVDYGIGGIHLAYDLLDGYDELVLIDAVARGGQPGTVVLLEVDDAAATGTQIDAHGMDPHTVLASVRALGGEAPRTLVVGCEPADTREGIGLSDAVDAAADRAVAAVLDLLRAGGTGPPVGPSTPAMEERVHEMGMCEGVLEAVERRAGGRAVEAVGVRIGDHLAVVPEVFEQSFQIAAQGGVADGAAVQITPVPGDELVLEWLRYRPTGAS